MKTVLLLALAAAGCRTARPEVVTVRVAYLAPTPVIVETCVRFRDDPAPPLPLEDVIWQTHTTPTRPGHTN